MAILFSVNIQAAGDDIRDMNFKGADIRDVLRAVAEIAGVNLVTDGSVKGNITIHLKDISFQKALTLITQSHGLDYRWDGNTVVVATPERIKNIYEEQDLKIKVLKNNDLERIRSIVTGIYPELNIQIDSRNEQLILVGSEKMIKNGINLIEKIKSPESITEEIEIDYTGKKEAEIEIMTEIITLKYSNPETILKNIKEIFPELKLSANLENKQIIVHGGEKTAEKAVAMINRLDTKSSSEDELEENKSEEVIYEPEETEVEEYTEKVKIKNGNPETLKKEIQNMEPELQIKVDNINEQLIITGTDKINVENAISLAKKWDSKQATRTEIIRVDYIDRENIKSIVNSMHPDINFNINKDVREIIVRGKAEEIEKVVTLIEKLDVPRRQVIIEARVEEVSSSDLSEIGVNPEEFTSIHFIRDNNDQITDAELTWPEFLRATEKEGTSETLANPHLMTLNGESASILIGDRIPFEIPESDGDMRVKYEEVGIKLNFTPWITKNNEIELKLRPEVSSLGEERANGYNVIQTREVETNVRLRDGETFAIGGLIQEDTLESMQEVPILSEIPILGELFRQRKSDLQKTELLIFITPRIVNDVHEEEVSGNGLVKEENTSRKIEEKEEEPKDNNVSENKGTEDKTATSCYNILKGNELEKIVNYSRRKRVYNTKDNLPDTLDFFYSVQEGETVADIADRFAISAERIRKTNNIKKELLKNTLITLPIPRTHLYRIKWGETLYQIANRYNIELERLLDINRIKRENYIPGGFIILLPKSIN